MSVSSDMRNKMIKYNYLEDLPNEILRETFSYLHALDLFYALNNLNQRISSILKEIRLHVLIERNTSRCQIGFLCEKLYDHCDQVISMDISNESFDRTNLIEYLFEEYFFVNLVWYRFSSFASKSNFEYVLRKLKKQNEVVYLNIDDMESAETDNAIRDRAHLFSKEILLDPPSKLRHLIFRIPYNYPGLIDCPIGNSNLTSIELNFYGKHDNKSIYVLIYVFRLHRSLRRIRAVFENYIKPGCVYVG